MSRKHAFAASKGMGNLNRFRWFLATAATIITLSGCTPTPATPFPTARVAGTSSPASLAPTAETPAPAAPAATPLASVPEFKYIVTIVLENKEFGTVIGSARMPYFNALARSNTLLTAHYAVAHPSLPNYLALISGETFGLNFDCIKCLYDVTTLPDLIESSGRTWKTYQEDMPSACYEGPDHGHYAMKHNPFMFFESIRLDAERCSKGVVPFTQLYADITAKQLPNYAFITPNLCNDAHDCGLDAADKWLESLMLVLQPALEDTGAPYLIILTWDEGQGDHSCCGMPAEAGGRVATVLVSPQGRSSYEDSTPYTHYSILKTIAEAWHLRYLGKAAESTNQLIIAPWK